MFPEKLYKVKFFFELQKMFGEKKTSLKDSERSLISETVSIEGTINSSGAIDIAGLVKGPVYSKEVIVRETGSITGSIQAELIEIHGHMDGKVTGEDVVEIHVHGSQIVIDKILHSLGTIQNVRMAEPGEFSKQSFLNNKMDLTAIEAMGDLINAQTEAQLENALSQMGGTLSELYLSWRKTLIELVAKEATLPQVA